MSAPRRIREEDREVYREEFPVVGEYKYLIVQADGINWLTNDDTGSENLAILHEMEVPGHSVHEYICSYFDPKVTFLDIGAHAGHYALRAAKAGCNVIAVEANPETAGILRFNRDLNHLKCTIWAFAAWDKVETVTITVPSHATLRNAEASVAGPLDFDPIAVRVLGQPLDNMPVKRIDLVKMDVEGADVHVFDGMHKLLTRCTPLIIHEDHLEVGTYSEAEIQRVYDRLTDDAGYEWYDIRELGVVSDMHGKYMVGKPGRFAGDIGRTGDSR